MIYLSMELFPLVVELLQAAMRHLTKMYTSRKMLVLELLLLPTFLWILVPTLVYVFLMALKHSDQRQVVQANMVLCVIILRRERLRGMG